MKSILPEAVEGRYDPAIGSMDLPTGNPMMAKQSAFRTLVMIACVAGLAYGATQIGRLPSGPRWILARFGRWLQDQAEPMVVADHKARIPIRPGNSDAGGQTADSEWDGISRSESERISRADGHDIQDTQPGKQWYEKPKPPKQNRTPVSSPERPRTLESLSEPLPMAKKYDPLSLLGQPVDSKPSNDSVSSLTELASQLQKLGATNYLLERWGDDGRLYHFQCEVAIGGLPGLRQHFDAVAASGEEAIRRVVEGVAAAQ